MDVRFLLSLIFVVVFLYFKIVRRFIDFGIDAYGKFLVLVNFIAF